MADPVKPTIEIDEPDLMTEHQNDGDALRPSDTRDKGRPQKDRKDDLGRKSSLT